MNAVEQRASLHEKTVQGVADGSVTPIRGRRPRRRPRNGRVRTVASIDSLHPLVKQWVKENDVKISEVTVISSEEIIVRKGY